jgi:hypothetical protein
VTVLQDLAQAQQRWGRDRADTIVNNHRARIFGAGVADDRTLTYLRSVLGDEQVEQISSTSGERGRRSTTRSTTYRALAGPHLVRQARQDTAVLVYGALPPARIATSRRRSSSGGGARDGQRDRDLAGVRKSRPAPGVRAHPEPPPGRRVDAPRPGRERPAPSARAGCALLAGARHSLVRDPRRGARRSPCSALCCAAAAPLTRRARPARPASRGANSSRSRSRGTTA